MCRIEISKELLSEVLDINPQVEGYPFNISSYNNVLNFETNYGEDKINIYELAHKCKEWALTKNRELYSSARGHCFISNLNPNNSDNIIDHYADTEPESIIKACEYILKETL